MTEKTETNETTVEELKERIEKLEQQQNQIQEEQQQIGSLFEQFKTGRISRRTFMTTAAAIAGVSYVAGTASAQTNPQWSNAIGRSGTESEPLKAIFARDAYHQSLSTEKESIGNVVGIIYSTTNQTIPTGTTTTVEFDTSEEEDTQVVSVDLANNKITVQEDGVYLIHTSMRYRGGTFSTGDRVIPRIKVNGSPAVGGIDAKAGTDFQTFEKWGVNRLSANDDVTAATFHNSGSDETIDGSQASTRLEVVRVG